MNKTNGFLEKLKKYDAKREAEKILAGEVLKDFKQRQSSRKPFENEWLLNMNFLMGNQYSTVSSNGEIENVDKQYFWQERQIFNHIAPLIEVRLSKLAKLRPVLTVVPASNEDKDIKTAKASKNILKFACNEHKLSEVISETTKWSEICGTGFYKIVWNNYKGDVLAVNEIGEKIRSGDIEIASVSPFEIFPDNVTSQNLAKCQSIIHAKVVPVNAIKEKWGVTVECEKLNVFSLDSQSGAIGGSFDAKSRKITDCVKEDGALVLERYQRANAIYPSGKLTIVCGDKVLYDGDLPYINGADVTRDFPFVMQSSCECAGSFWGTSIIERVIPVQRAYNAIKNRKHEFLNRLSMGVLNVEEGSCDVDNLEDEGLCPGKVLVYRQGSNPPSFMSGSSIPSEFDSEEANLLTEMLTISGVSDLMFSSSSSASKMSGTALELLQEQDDTRLSSTCDSVKFAIKSIGEQILRLYKQFASVPRLAKISSDNGTDVFYFSNADISASDIAFESEPEANQSMLQKRNMVFELLKNNVLCDENGKISQKMRTKILEMLGFGIYENALDISELHIKKADKENLDLISGKKVEVCEIDDHELHLSSHIAFMLGAEYEKAKQTNKTIEEDFLSHIRNHKELISIK